MLDEVGVVQGPSPCSHFTTEGQDLGAGAGWEISPE